MHLFYLENSIEEEGQLVIKEGIKGNSIVQIEEEVYVLEIEDLEEEQELGSVEGKVIGIKEDFLEGY